MDILRKACWIFFLLSISITAIEALTSYVGVKFMRVSEIGYARIWVYSYGPELGFTIAFLWVSSLPFVFLFLSLLFLHLTRRSSWFGIAFFIPFIELGATSLWNLPGAVNDAMVVLYGTSTTILFPWENVLISFGAFVAVSLYFYVLWKHPPQWWKEIKTQF